MEYLRIGGVSFRIQICQIFLSEAIELERTRKVKNKTTIIHVLLKGKTVCTAYLS